MMPLALLLVACGGPPAAPPPLDAPTQLGAQDVAVAAREVITAGPRVSGVLDAAQKAVLRAEAAGTAEQVLVEVGQAVHKGDLLVRIEAAAVQASQASAASGVESAQQDVVVAERELARVKHLVEVGALAARDQELAESNLLSTRSRLKGARAQAAGAGEQVSGTVVRAPLNGVVSERAVSTGDVVAPGSPLFTILDPTSLRLTGSVPADAAGSLKVGAPVRITVQGQAQPFEGTLERVAPAVDPATRQIPVIITLPNADGALIAGLFAEGEIATQSAEGIVIPADALSARHDVFVVEVVRAGKVEAVPVEIGLRNDSTERVEITAGLQAGDVVLVGPARGMSQGTPVALPPAGG